MANNTTKKNCPICLEDNTSYITFNCGHNTCTKCFLTNIIHLNTKCPMCRSHLLEVEPLLKKFHDDLLNLNKVQVELFDLETENRELRLDIKNINKKNKIYKRLSKNLTTHVLETFSDEEEEEFQEFQESQEP